VLDVARGGGQGRRGSGNERTVSAAGPDGRSYRALTARSGTGAAAGVTPAARCAAPPAVSPGVQDPPFRSFSPTARSHGPYARSGGCTGPIYSGPGGWCDRR
jgi:hypothetical protein